MKSKVLACDIDGCLNLFTSKLIEIVNKKYDLNLSEELTDHEVLDILGHNTPEKISAFWNEIQSEVDTCETFPKAVENLQKLRIEDNIKVVLVTARGYHIAKWTEKWLESRGFIYDDIIFNAGTKVDVCLWKNFEIMIEDLPRNIIALSDKGVRVLIPNHKYNQLKFNEHTIRCNDWDEIREEVKKYFEVNSIV